MMREIPVLGRLAKTEPEMISGIPGRIPALLEHSDRIARTLRRSGARMPDDELLVVAELLLRLASTFLLDPGGRLDVERPGRRTRLCEAVPLAAGRLAVGHVTDRRATR